MADGYLNFDTKINEKGFNDGISKLGSLGKSGLSIVSKAMTGAIAAVGTGAAAIIKSSLGVVANMEQQVGGVETLFKDSANTVIANANKAYKTAGMSANNYMETVTSFSASLLQSLGGNTVKAASYADRAIVDMSDNANKMGTNMRDIQNAYQGFAKQNYTMLDNLKLGYGGTQEEMKRLISDASKMTDVQKELGVTVDASSLSFGNIVNAISVVQKQMGITGTTSKEAATTIEGSVNSAKAAWENFEAGVISANDLVETFWTAAQNIFTNLGQIIPRLGKTGMDVVSALAGKIGGAVPQVKGFTDSISKLANELKGMNSDQLLNLGKMAVVIAGSAPALSIFGKGIENVKTATGGFNDIVDGVVASIGKVPKRAKSASATFKKIGDEFKFLGESIALPFQDLGEKIAPRLKDLGGFMAESWANGPGGKITGAVTNTVKKIGESFGKIGPKLAEKFPGITKKFAELGAKMSAASAKVSKVLGKVGTKISEYAGFIGNAFTPILSRVASFAPTFFKLINIGAGAAIIVAGMGLIYSQFGTQIDQLLLLAQTKGPEVITNFANGITAALPGLVAQGATLIMGILNAITANLPALVSAGVSIISTLAGSLGAQLPQLIPCAVRMIMTLVSSLAGNLPKLIQSGLKLMKGLASGIANSIPIVAAKAPVIIGKLASTIITNLPKILTAGVQIVSKLAVGLVRGIPALIGKIPSMVSQIRNAFTSVNWGSVGMNIVKGIASGLANAGGVIVKAAKSAAKSALDAAKSALGIHSPSRVFRDQVGKMMALGMGIGFEKNIPLKSMNVGVQRAVSGLQKSVDLALSARTVDKTVGRVKSYPGFDGGKDIDYDRLERIQMKAADKLSKRPIYLGTKRIDEPLPKGAVPVW
nr:MAG TPA: tail tape measure protein [Caudoviricetes sp.]